MLSTAILLIVLACLLPLPQLADDELDAIIGLEAGYPYGE